ncbi:septum formation protein Maf [Lyngbya aestuarii BL J]|uniref:Nucleoside triphosphate pyrophosphatase n=1 Tax=Lyngbya aestuarii BL J TaxID=1348334 RepID=U7QQE8_9CYAN|nr:nucleoside triphosphate pyrophosphatase [Lyngbya aestuarii]ERT09340.1 septum formation protein Maf [Lyngbya aestuarii BL J]
MATENQITFILASASPARRRLLQNLGIPARVCPSGFDESQIQLNNPAELVKTLARCKAEAVANLLTTTLSDSIPHSNSALILGCDSVLEVDGEIYGKPENKTEAIARWKVMRSHYGRLFTGHALIDFGQQKTIVYSRVTTVYFAEVSDAEIEAYVATEEPLNCAGCFAIEGKGGVFIEKIEGCHTNVIGLSLPLLRKMLQELGHDVTQFWQAENSEKFYTSNGDPQFD